MAFTREQQLAIDTEGSNIIVSAGAGSGKTAVLTERVIRKLKDGVDVDKLLILTFTNEAANEMKGRIRKAITANGLDRQLDLIDSAYITTFDSYALSLVKKYHYVLNIPKDIKIIDSGIITIYKYKALDQIFLDMYGDDKFNNLINDYCLKDDTSIKKFILNISNKLDLLTNKQEYLDNYLNNYTSIEFYNMVLDEYMGLINNKINDLHIIYDNFINYATDNLISKLDSWFKPLFTGKTYEEYLLFNTIPTVRFAGVSEEGIKKKEELKEKVQEIKDLLRFDNTDKIIDSLKTNKDNLEVIIEILIKLDNLVYAYKDKHGVYEFNDISHMAINIVKYNLEIRNEIKEYFNEIMIDEYQDTSDIQEVFISYIMNNNVYMVGDIKQSIYRFRNANPYIFYNKYEKYSKNDGGIKIDLLKNFRSRKETLNNINEIFNLVMDDEIGNANYLKDHNMVYGNTDYDLEDSLHDNNMEIYSYKMDEDDKFSKEEKEIFIIAEDILDKIKNGYLVFDKNTKKLRQIKYSDICIITDRNKYLSLYRKILEYMGIPSVIYMDNELNQDIVFLVIKNLIDLVNHVNNKIFDNQFRYLFTSVARSFLFEYDDNTIYQILDDKSFYQSDIIKKCYDVKMDEPIIEIINNIFNTFDVYKKLIKLNNMNENIIRIDSIINLVNDLSSLGYNIQDIINYLSDMDSFELPVKYTVNVSNKDAVKIMNIHKSKGLEFSLCYFTGMHNKFTVKDVSSKFIYCNKYGIILPYMKDSELDNTILRDLYTDLYYKEEISEKIRLFYVALTRCREKMIILANLDDENIGYNHLVPYQDRIKYRSFLDIIKSIAVTNKYLIEKEANYTKEYNFIKLKEIKNEDEDTTIVKKQIHVDYQKIDIKKHSKDIHDLINLEKIKVMEYGTKIHEIFEYDDFYNPKSKYVKDLLKHIDNGFINIYKEYEFSYFEKGIKYTGIIDLMIEYSDIIYIVDYKLKNISDSEYVKQIMGYKKYISTITNKDIKTFLYSVIDNTFVEVTNE